MSTWNLLGVSAVVIAGVLVAAFFARTSFRMKQDGRKSLRLAIYVVWAMVIALMVYTIIALQQPAGPMLR